MTEKLRDQVSAFIDDELSDAESGLFAERLSRDVELRRALERYNLIGAAMRDELPAQLPPRLAQRVGDALEAEVTYSRLSSRFDGMLKPLVGVAVAATVAAVALLGLQRAPDEIPAPELADSGSVTVPERPANYAPSIAPEIVPASTGPISPARREQLDRYLITHGQNAPPARRAGVMIKVLQRRQPQERLLQQDTGFVPQQPPPTIEGDDENIED